MAFVTSKRPLLNWIWITNAYCLAADSSTPYLEEWFRKGPSEAETNRWQEGPGSAREVHQGVRWGGLSGMPPRERSRPMHSRTTEMYIVYNFDLLRLGLRFTDLYTLVARRRQPCYAGLSLCLCCQLYFIFTLSCLEFNASVLRNNDDYWAG